MFLKMWIRQFLKSVYLILRKVILQVLSGLYYGGKKNRIPDHPKEILIISQQRLGDAVLSLPFFTALGKGHPGATIEVLCPPAEEEFYSLVPEVDTVLARPFRFKEVLIGKLPQYLQGKRFDLLIDLNTDGSLFPALVTARSGARWSIGYGQDGRGIFFDEALPDPPEQAHTVERFLALLAPLGIKNPSPEVRIALTADRNLFSFGKDGSEELPLVGIHPGGTHWTQCWPVEYYAQLSDLLIEKGFARVVLCGGPSDWDLIRRVQERMRREPEIAPPVPSLKDFALFLQGLDLLICNNSGPLHLACAVGTKTFSFMGPTKAEQWWPRGEGHHVFRLGDLYCIGCNSGYCRIGSHDCLRGISPHKVFQTVRKTISHCSDNKSLRNNAQGFIV